MSKRRLISLFAKSIFVQKQIDAELLRPLPDSLKLLRLKKIRLAIKDKIYRMTHRERPLPARKRLGLTYVEG